MPEVASAIMKITLFIALSGIVFLAGCALKVTQTDLAGHWQMTGAATHLLNLRLPGGQRPTLDLRTDGTLIATNVPTSAFRDMYRWRRLYSGMGKWSIPPTSRTEGFATVVLEFTDDTRAQPTGLIMYVDRDNHGFCIFAWLDEEGGERLSFRR